MQRVDVAISIWSTLRALVVRCETVVDDALIFCCDLYRSTVVRDIGRTARLLRSLSLSLRLAMFMSIDRVNLLLCQ